MIQPVSDNLNPKEKPPIVLKEVDLAISQIAWELLNKNTGPHHNCEGD